MKDNSCSICPSWLAIFCNRSVSAPWECNSFCISASCCALPALIRFCSSFSSLRIFSCWMFFSSKSWFCKCAHASFKALSLFAFSCPKLSSFSLTEASSKAILLFSSSSRVNFSLRAASAFFFQSSRSSMSCWYWRSSFSNSYSNWLIRLFCSFINGWYFRFICSCPSAFSACKRCMRIEISAERCSFSSFSLL